MKLMTKQLEKRFAQVGRQDGVKDPLVSPSSLIRQEPEPGLRQNTILMIK